MVFKKKRVKSAAQSLKAAPVDFDQMDENARARENARLRRENVRLKEEVEILTKFKEYVAEQKLED